MSRMKSFWSGVLLGIGGLTAAVFLDRDKNALSKTGEHADFTPDAAKGMPADAVIRQLSRYSWQLTRLSLANLVIDSEYIDLVAGSFAQPEDTWTEKMQNGVQDMCTTIGRRGKEINLRQAGQRIEGLYQEYRPVFVRANQLLAAHGMAGVSLKDLTLAGHDFSLNNSASNENWGEEVAALQAMLNDFAERTSEAALTLTSRLENLVGQSPAPPREEEGATSMAV